MLHGVRGRHLRLRRDRFRLLCRPARVRRTVYIMFVLEVSAEAQGEPMRLDWVQVADELRRLRAVGAVADAGAAASSGGQHDF